MSTASDDTELTAHLLTLLPAEVVRGAARHFLAKTACARIVAAFLRRATVEEVEALYQVVAKMAREGLERAPKPEPPQSWVQNFVDRAKGTVDGAR